MKSSILYLIDSNGKKEIKEEISDFNKVEYLLIPIQEYNSSCFILISPNRAIKEFYRAEISYEMNVEIFNEYTGIVESAVLTPLISTKYQTITDFYNFLHSLNRIYYMNTLFNSNSETSPIAISFPVFQFTVYNKEGESIFSYDNTSKKIVRTSPEDILDEIEFFYDPLLPKNIDLDDQYKYMIIHSKKKKSEWRFYPDRLMQYITVNDLIGVPLDTTKSICFIRKEELERFHSIKDLFVTVFRYHYLADYDIEKLNLMSERLMSDPLDTRTQDISFYYYDAWLHITNDIVEYFHYFPMTRAINRIIGSLLMEKDVSEIEVYTNISINLYPDSIHYFKGRQRCEINLEIPTDKTYRFQEFIEELFRLNHLYYKRIGDDYEY